MTSNLIADYLNLEDAFWNALDAGLLGYDSELEINSRNQKTVDSFCEQMTYSRYVHAILSYAANNETRTYWISFVPTKNDLNRIEVEGWPL